MIDSSTSAVWLRKTNFWEIIGKDMDPIQEKVPIKTAHHFWGLYSICGVRRFASRCHSGGKLASRRPFGLQADCILKYLFVEDSDVE
jgi:hypothetical protein